jgi:hypothetical protein
MSTVTRFAFLIVTLAACGDSAPTQPDASGESAACASVGTTFCRKMYACLTPQQIADFQLPPTEAECVTMQNANCDAAAPEPGYCKGHPQTSAGAATACAADLDALSCPQLLQTPPPNDVCKTQLCAM